MPSVSRATKVPVAVYRGVDVARRRGSKPRRAADLSSTAALLDMMRAVSTTLDPAAVAGALVERAVTWLPMPSWAIVADDRSGQLALDRRRRWPSSAWAATSP